jgi:hypothetical protein
MFHSELRPSQLTLLTRITMHITIEEWLDSPVHSTSGDETCSMLDKQRAKFDPDSENVGYLTKDQAINLKS